MKRALVLGGGVAGIAACFELCDRGYAVTLIEAHRWLGGRAFSLPLGDLRARPDNGPHVMLGCYDFFRRLLRRLGSEGGLDARACLRLDYRGEGVPAATLQLSRLPPAMALPLALLRFPPFSIAERIKACGGLLASVLPTFGRTLESWIERHHQGGAVREHLWDPLCRAVMNAEPAEVDAGVFLKALRRAFGGSAVRAAIWIPAMPWSALIGEPALSKLREAGVEVRLGVRVLGLRVEHGVVRGLRIAHQEEISLGADDLVVSAIPWHAMSRLLGTEFPADGIGSSPIISVYCQAESGQGLPDESLVALVAGDPFHFFFRRVGGEAGEFALLAAGGQTLQGLGVAQIEQLAKDQLRRHFPDYALPLDLQMRVVREQHATMVVAPGTDRLRPKPGLLPGYSNLRVCGDWTATGLPSTLESAAESADLALRDLD